MRNVTFSVQVPEVKVIDFISWCQADGLRCEITGAEGRKHKSGPRMVRGAKITLTNLNLEENKYTAGTDPLQALGHIRKTFKIGQVVARKDITALVCKVMRKERNACSPLISRLIKDGYLELVQNS